MFLNLNNTMKALTDKIIECLTDKHGEWVRYSDQQFYLDISVIQLLNNKQE
jgi:hypothetical protein